MSMSQPIRHALPVPNFNGAPGTHQLTLYEWGDPAASRVTLCVHGLTRNARDFDRISAALAETGRRVLALNMAGRGDAQRLADPMGYQYPAYVQDCLAVMDNFHLRGVEWLGTSMGGIIGMWIAANNPGRIRKLILNDIGIHISAEALQRIYSYVRTIGEAFADAAAAEAYLRSVLAPFGITREEDWQHLLAHSFTRAADGRYHYACDPAIAVPLAAGSANFTQVSAVNLAPVWEPVKLPTLILRGARSDVLEAATVQAMRVMNPRTDALVFEGIGHAPALMDAPQIRPVLEWLDASAALSAMGI